MTGVQEPNPSKLLENGTSLNIHGSGIDYGSEQGEPEARAGRQAIGRVVALELVLRLDQCMYEP